MTLLSDIYDVTLKREIRETANGGFVRPTIGEYFMTHKDWTAVANITPAYLAAFPGMSGLITISEDKLTFSNPTGDWTGPYIPIVKYSGKWYIEYKHGGTSGFGIRDATTVGFPNHYAPLPHVTFIQNNVYQGAAYSYPVTSVTKGNTIAVGYDVDNHIFTIYHQGELIYTHNVETKHPSYKIPASNGIYFCACGYPDCPITIHATPIYTIPGFRYI